MGAIPKAEDMIKKPDALIRYEMVKSMGALWFHGGIEDQPHMWIMEYAVCQNVKAQFDALEARRIASESKKKSR